MVEIKYHLHDADDGVHHVGMTRVFPSMDTTGQAYVGVRDPVVFIGLGLMYADDWTGVRDFSIWVRDTAQDDKFRFYYGEGDHKGLDNEPCDDDTDLDLMLPDLDLRWSADD